LSNRERRRAARPGGALGHALGLQRAGRLGEAEAAYRQVIEAEPENADALHLLGVLSHQMGHGDRAVRLLGKAIALQGANPAFHNNLGNILRDRGEEEAAIGCYRRAIDLKPDYAQGHYNLAGALRPLYRLGEVIRHYDMALAYGFGSAETHNNLAGALVAQGRSEEAIPHYREALALKPDYAKAGSNLLLALHYGPSTDAGALFAEHKNWAERHGLPSVPLREAGGVLAAAVEPHGNDASPERRLRIGYVSRDFRAHSVAYFAEPIIAGHDRAGFEVICYSDAGRGDDVTARFRALADGWRDTRGLDDDALARRVREDAVDILVDLGGHTADNRLGVFAGKPAPVQVSYLGYPDTSGLGAIDYRLTDASADPPGAADDLSSEELIRLPHGFLCYRPPEAAPEAARQGAPSIGAITFASFNDLAKLTSEVVALWSEILLAVPGSRLILKTVALADEASRERLGRMFTANGVAKERIDLKGRIPAVAGHLDLYNGVDIALDSFPYNGATTTCEALWMGVPVVSLAGDRHASRVGKSLLTNVGIPELIAETPKAYVELATGLANDPRRLGALHRELRQRMAGSPVTDERRFVSALEDAYRRMWRRWCEGTEA
jgi:predicted O-linked N-acetylglucosamine transferase (SPINDLY family)